MRGAYGRQQTMPQDIHIRRYTSTADEILPAGILRLCLPSNPPVFRQSRPKAAAFPVNDLVGAGFSRTRAAIAAGSYTATFLRVRAGLSAGRAG